MSDTPLGTAMEIKEHSGWFTALGILFIIGGVFAIAMPFVATVVATLWIGWAFIILGAVEVYQSWSTRGWGGFIWNLLIGLVIVAGGISFVVFPLEGATTLTLVVGALFIAKGVIQVIMAFQYRPRDGWVWILLAGILAVVLGFLIVMGWPQTTVWVLGTLVGISLIFSGWSYVMIASAARRLSAA